MNCPIPALVLLVISSLLNAGDTAALQVITLKDNSVIRAQVTEISGGFYHVMSPVLGDMKIPTGEVVSIQEVAAVKQGDSARVAEPKIEAPSGVTAAGPSPVPAGVESARAAVTSKVQSLVSSREGMNAVMEFSGNSDLKAVMNDPQTMRAIQSGDYDALMKSPRMKKLLDNPQTKSLIQSVINPVSRETPQSSPR